ncbi:DUF4352 domain-containing protein [Nocardia fusca]|uniref:DUF4352 domain-containing protein n=1 Tax=Nocardia fusca TaxID=941183 RepID=UPI003799B49D
MESIFRTALVGPMLRRAGLAAWFGVMCVMAVALCGCVGLGTDDTGEVHPVGSQVEVGGFGFVVIGIDGPISEVGTGGPKKVAEGQYLVVHVEVTNVGAEPLAFFGGAPRLIGDDGRDFGPDRAAELVLESDPFEDPVGEMIAPQVARTMTVVFDVPVSVRPAAVEFRHIVSKSDLDTVRVAVA